jgi:AcrR family transcriptional regulator
VTALGRAPRKDVTRNRARLLRAADELIATDGLDVSFNALARHAGMGVGTVYAHFRDRDELLDALVDRRIDVVVTLLQELATIPDPVEGLRRALIGMSELQARDKGIWQTLAVTAGDRPHAAVQERITPFIASLVNRARAGGRVRPELEVSDVFTILWIGGALAERRPGQWRRYVELMLAGFLAEGQR